MNSYYISANYHEPIPSPSFNMQPMYGMLPMAQSAPVLPKFYPAEEEYDPYGEEDDENLNAEVIEVLNSAEQEVYNAALEKINISHPFIKYYRDKQLEFNFAKTTRAEIDNYTNEKALRFIAKSAVWERRENVLEELPVVPRTIKAVFQFYLIYDTHALYRVISIKEDKYILVACHLNVTGFDRGDLRFVEVNRRTRTNASKVSCIGHLAHGDLVAVTGLLKLREVTIKPNVYQVTQETPCYFMVSDMTLLKRQWFNKVPFSFLENGTAVALKWGQVLTVRNKDKYPIKTNCIFLGSGMIPEKVHDFASGFTPDGLIQLTGLTREITRYPASTGTIFTHVFSPYYTQQMEIGHDAYSFHIAHNHDPGAIVELCALMGATAVAAVSNGNFDGRCFKLINPSKNQDMLFFSIDNTEDPKPSGLWKVGTRINVGSSVVDANASIETVMELGNELKISARLSRENLDFKFTDSVHVVAQREIPEGKQLRDGFLEKIPDNSNGKMILTALYGGPPIPVPELTKSCLYLFPGTTPVPLNQYQNEYVDRLLQKTPLTLANSPFGCGKSMTIATAAYYAVERSRILNDGSQQLLVTQSNFASVNLVDITKRYMNKCRVIRYVSESNWLELPEEGRTDLDLPFQMERVFYDFVSGKLHFNATYYLFQMAIFLKEKKLITVEEMEPRCQDFFKINPDARKYDFFKLSRTFFMIWKPEIIITTSDSLRNVFPFLTSVSTVQFDEASQVPECALIQVLATFPFTCFGLVGDINQLPPFCDHLLTGHLKLFGVGNTMERAIRGRLFPQVNLRYVYRCHPVTTQILGCEFYGGILISGTTAEARSELMIHRPDFWPNSNFPIMVVDNNQSSKRMGTSLFNENELGIVRQIVYSLTSPTYNYTFNPSDIGIISFYKVQTSYLCEQFRDLNVKCGTVDSFQGTEKEIMILCCTNEVINGFLLMRNRINVAMSRAKQTTIIVGNLSGLERANHWKTFVQLARANRCIKSFN